MMSAPLSLPPLGLYVHIPWCLKKCPYCDFNSHAAKDELPEQDYIRQLLADLEGDLHYVQNREIASVFIGGGTPSLFTPNAIGTLLEAINTLTPLAGNAEITLEANPGTFEVNRFRDFRRAGVNRLSVGIQSFDPNFLHTLGRVHDDGEARHAAEQLRTAGFDNFNLDLMFGLPGQNIQQAMRDIETALACDPPHLSWYQLTIEPNTVFYRRPPALPGDDLIGEMQEQGIALLTDAGLSRYEISAYGQADHQSRHNLNYWQFGDYLGIGAGAHGKITLPAEKRIVRTRKTRQPDHYLAKANDFCAETIAVPIDDLPLEFMMNALRLCDGIDENLFSERTGLSLQTIAEPLAQLRGKGLLEPDRLQTTPKGLAFLNDVLEVFMPDGLNAADRIEVHSL